ncbi:MAG: polysaccharide biosynthesis protein [Janthinobacterium lividum]
MKNISKVGSYLLKLNFLPTFLVKYILDLSCLFLSYISLSYILNIPYLQNFYINGIFLIVISIAISCVSGLYHHVWRYTSLYNIFEVFKYCFSISLLFTFWFYIKYDQQEIIIKLFFLFLIFSFSAFNFTRIFIRILFDQTYLASQKNVTNVILIGAGKGGELFIKQSKKNLNKIYQIDGILDDDPNLWGRKLSGIKIYGPIKDLGKLTNSNDIQMVIIAIPSLFKEKLLEITTNAKELGLEVRVLPSFDDLLIHNQTLPENISVEDLLGRDSINLAAEDAAKFIKNKVILITGAGGSIGSEICRQLIVLGPEKIIIVDHGEYNLYKISWELEHVLNFKNFSPILANVSDQNSMSSIFQIHQPQVVFHAAAYKHVPLLEKQAKQAIQNNFFGTKNVAELASLYNCEKFILISTDKAVNPTNVMGSTKRMAEIFCQNFSKISKTCFVTVRFGNVLGSAGSVIPLFKKQLKQGGPLTVTDPEITRFFMSIPEASQLVLQAGAMGVGGEIFVLDMGKPIKILDLAERLITLTGKRPYKDVDIIFTGLRPGEKLYEELFYENEGHIATKRKKIFLANSTSIDFQDFLTNVNQLERNLKDIEESDVVKIISKMVPEAKINIH